MKFKLILANRLKKFVQMYKFFGKTKMTMCSFEKQSRFFQGDQVDP